MNSDTPRRHGSSLSRRSFLSNAALVSIGSFVGQRSSAGQVLELFSGIGIDVGKKLLDKGINYALGAPLNDLFKEPTLTDVHQWIDQSVTLLEKKIDALSAKIDSQNLNLMQSQLDSVRSAFNDYVSLDPATRREYKTSLIQCEFITSQLLSLSQKYDQAFFLSTVVVAYRLLTKYALYQLDKEDGKNGQGHITSLESGREIQSYLYWAAQTRTRLVSSLAPHYAAHCTTTPVVFHADNFECVIYKNGTVVGTTGSAKLSEKEKWYEQLSNAAERYLNDMPQLTNDLNTWRAVNRKSREQIVTADHCMREMYYSATGKSCPPLLDTKMLDLKNTATFQYNNGYGWSTQRDAFAP